MRLRSLIALSLLLAGGSASAAVAPLVCPSPVTQKSVRDPSLDQDLVSVELYQGTRLVTTAAMTSVTGSWTPFSVYRNQAYTSALRASGRHQDNILITPGTAHEGLDLMVRTDVASPNQRTVSYAITVTNLDNMIEAGPPDARISVPQQIQKGPYCGQVALKDGESETFPLNQDGLVARITRRAMKAAPVASAP